MRGAWAAVAVAWGALGGACVDLAPYQCAADAQCRSEAGPGWCEDTSYCSYPDLECPSGRRYSDLAGTLGRQCVAPGDATGSSSTAAGSGGGTVTDSADSGTSGATGEPSCGNGVVEGDEECDELDAVDGDGCNTDCTAGGSIRWERIVASDTGGDDRFFGLVHLVSGDVVAVGYLQAATRDVLISRFTIEGDEVQRVVHDFDGGTDEAEGITQDGVGQLHVCGIAESMGESRPWVGSWDAPLTAGPDVDLLLPAPLAGYCHDLVHVEGNTFTAVGGSGGMAWAYRFLSFDVAGGTVAVADPMGAMGESRLKAVVRGVDTEVLVAGQLAEIGVAYAPVTADELGPALLMLPQTQVQSMVVVADSMVVAGWHAGAGSLDDLWISAHDLDGTERWTFSPPHPLIDEVEDLAVDPAGNVYAIGHVSADDPDRWVGKLDPEGDLVWERNDFPGSLGTDRGRSLVVLPDGDLVVVAEVTGPGGDLDAWIARLAP